MILSGALLSIEFNFNKVEDIFKSISKFSESYLTVIKVSAVHKTPNGFAVLLVGTPLNSIELFEFVLKIERFLNENFEGKLKLLLLAKDKSLEMNGHFILPHPSLLQDSLTFLSAKEVWPSYLHPVMNLTLEELSSSAEHNHNAAFAITGLTALNLFKH